MKNVNQRGISPVKYPRSKRNHPVMHLSSFMPGVAHPVAFVPMFREDSLVGQMTGMVEMLETKEILMNKVRARFTAWCVPFLAADRFKGSRDELDLSYMGKASLSGAGVIPFMQNTPLPVGGAAAVPLYKAAGLHGNAGDQINTFLAEAYNQIFNTRCDAMSDKLVHRELDDTTLAPAFWHHRQFPHIVADFAQATMEGKAAIDVVESKLPVKGIGLHTRGAAATLTGLKETGGGTRTTTGWVALGAEDGPATAAGTAVLGVEAGTGVSANFPSIYAEMQAHGLEISLAGLEEARKLQVWAEMRAGYGKEIDDEYIIDMMMQGLTVPDQHLKRPFQIAEQITTFSQAKRYATDSGNLEDSAVSGVAAFNMRLRVPRISTGGLVVVLCEVLPDQLWERQKDWFFHTRPKDGRAGHVYWPDAERDFLDREKVDVVYNEDIDISHANPTAHFGYDPMNAKFNRGAMAVGGKFHRPAVTTPEDQARQRLYAIEGANPALTTSFFIASPGTVHTKPWLDDALDVFEIAAEGRFVLTGNTQFGGKLIEETENYEIVASHAPGPEDQITKEVTP